MRGLMRGTGLALLALVLGSLIPVARVEAGDDVLRVTGYVHGVAMEIEVAPIGNGFYLRSDAAEAFLEMREAARRDGVILKVNSAFRTQEEQERLYKLYREGNGARAARPGFSNHQGGLAVDIEVGGSKESETYKWLDEHADEFGFNNNEGDRVNEPWHWVFDPQ